MPAWRSRRSGRLPETRSSRPPVPRRPVVSRSPRTSSSASSPVPSSTVVARPVRAVRVRASGAAPAPTTVVAATTAATTAEVTEATVVTVSCPAGATTTARDAGAHASETWPVGKAGLVSSTFHTGRLLVATPSVGGDVFHRSVILMLHHDDGGAQGVVLNKPLSAEVDSVLPGWQRVVTAPHVLFQGGPVSTSSALGLVTVPGDEPEPLGVKRLFGSIGLVDLDVPTPVVAAELAGLRIFAGYSGWDSGQLENEIFRGDWYVVDAEVGDAFTPEPDRLWSEVLRRQRDSLAYVANFPDDPSMN